MEWKESVTATVRHIMHSGKLNKQIRLKRPAKSYSNGEQVETWTTYATVWAHFKPVVSKEFEKTSVKFMAETHYEISIRYLTAVKTEDKFTHNGETYHIFGIIHDEEKRKQTTLYAKKALDIAFNFEEIASGGIQMQGAANAT